MVILRHTRHKTDRQTETDRDRQIEQCIEGHTRRERVAERAALEVKRTTDRDRDSDRDRQTDRQI